MGLDDVFKELDKFAEDLDEEISKDVEDLDKVVEKVEDKIEEEPKTTTKKTKKHKKAKTEKKKEEKAKEKKKTKKHEKKHKKKHTTTTHTRHTEHVRYDLGERHIGTQKLPHDMKITVGGVPCHLRIYKRIPKSKNTYSANVKAGSEMRHRKKHKG